MEISDLYDWFFSVVEISDVYGVSLVVEISDVYDVVFCYRDIRYVSVFCVEISYMNDVFIVVEISDV